MKKSKKMIVNIIVLLASIVIFLLMFELFLRFIGMGCSIRDRSGQGIYSLKDGIYVMKPNFTGNFRCTEFNTIIKTNSYGFRGNDIQPGRKNIIVIGDSMVFGHGVNQVETFSDLLDTKLKSKNYQVINLGVSGYSPKEYLNQLKTYIPIFKPKLVIVTITEWNDVQENCGIINRSESFIGSSSTGIGMVKDTLKKSYIVIFMEPLLKNIIDLGASNLAAKQFYYLNETDTVKACNLAMKESMRKMGQYENILFLLLPSKTSFLDSKDPSIDYGKQLKQLNKICNELNLSCINLKDYLDNPKQIFLNEGHLNKLGHIEVSDAIEKYLLKNNLIN